MVERRRRIRRTDYWKGAQSRVLRPLRGDDWIEIEDILDCVEDLRSIAVEELEFTRQGIELMRKGFAPSRFILMHLSRIEEELYRRLTMRVVR
jgi:hypothetical protein